MSSKRRKLRKDGRKGESIMLCYGRVWRCRWKAMEDIAREAVVSGTANAVAPKHFNFLQPH